MAVAVNDLLRVTAVLTTTDGTTSENVYVYKALGITDSDDFAVMADLALVLDTAYTEIVGLYANEVTFVEVRGHNITQDTPLPTVPWPTLTSGTSVSPNYAPGVAALVLFHTAATKVLGRKFIGPLTNAGLTDALIASATLVDLASYAAVLIVPYTSPDTSNSYSFGILDKSNIFRFITDVVSTAIPAYQRRRRQFTGI